MQLTRSSPRPSYDGPRGVRLPGRRSRSCIGSFDPVGARLLDAVDVMDTLRASVPWDREQTHESLVPYLLEEAYEVDRSDRAPTGDQLREELGDLLLQVLFHARLAAEDVERARSRSTTWPAASSRSWSVAIRMSSPTPWSTERRTSRPTGRDQARREGRGTSAMDGIPVGAAGPQPRRQRHRPGAARRRHRQRAGARRVSRHIPRRPSARCCSRWWPRPTRPGWTPSGRSAARVRREMTALRRCGAAQPPPSEPACPRIG